MLNLGPKFFFFTGPELLSAVLEWISGKADFGNNGSNWTGMRVAFPLVLIFFMVQQLLVGHGFFTIEASLRHTTLSRIHWDK